MFLWVTAQGYQQRGELDASLSAIQESVRLRDSLPNTDVRQRMRLAHFLIWEGKILGQANGISLGRSAEALAPLDRAFRITDEAVHQDAKDQSTRGRLAMAGLAMVDVLRESDAARVRRV